MPQVTKLVDQLIPKIEAQTLLDVGVGDGSTIASMIPFFRNPMVYCCDPHAPSPNTLYNYEWEGKAYHESKFYGMDMDIITFFDSLACYYKADGLIHLENAEKHAKKLIIVWGPDGYYPYPPFQSCWHAEDFLARGYCVYRAKNIHQGPPTVASGLLAWKVM